MVVNEVHNFMTNSTIRAPLLSRSPPNPKKFTHYSNFFQILFKNIVKNDFSPVIDI